MQDVVKVGWDLKIAVGRMVRRLRQSHEPGELSLSELSVLSRLDRDGPATPGALADGERIRPQALGNIVAVLEQRELVSRAPDPHDGRRVLMSVTRSGRKVLLDRRSHAMRRMTEALANTFDDDELRRLAAVVPLLERLADAL